MKLLPALCALALLGCSNADRSKPNAAADEEFDIATASPKVVDSLFKVWAIGLQPIVRARDSMLALARHDSGTEKADAVLENTEKLMDSLVQLGLGVPPLFEHRCDDNTEKCRHATMLADSLGRFLGSRQLFYRENNGPQAGVFHGALLTMFAPYLTPAFRAYHDLSLTNTASWEEEGRGIEVPWKQLGNLVADWEEFIERYPAFSGIDDARGKWKVDRDLFIAGGEYDPIFGDTASGRTLLPAVKDAYESFIKAHPKSGTAQLVTEFMDVLRASGYVHSPAVDEFLKSKNIDFYFPR